MRHNISVYGIVPKLLMTGNPSKNWPYLEFYKPHKAGTLAPYRKFIQALVDDNPDIDPSYKENLLKLDNNSKQRLLYGNWEYDDDPAALISYEKIVDIFTNDFATLNGEKYITADVARLGSDKIVVVVWDGFRVVQLVTANKERLNVTGNEIIEPLRQKYGIPKSNVLCDEDGVGGGLVDFMGYKGFVNNSKALPNPETKVDENYNHLKSQCYFRLADRINKGGLFIDVKDTQVKADIIKELEQVKQHNMDKDGKRQVLPKDKVKELIGRSPDYADALMMREYFELKPRLSWVAF
jgi:hypothetical protein